MGLFVFSVADQVLSKNPRSFAMSWLQSVHPVTILVMASGFLLGALLMLAVIH
jgi:hypothetical protein